MKEFTYQRVYESYTIEEIDGHYHIAHRDLNGDRIKDVIVPKAFIKQLVYTLVTESLAKSLLCQ